MFDRHMVKLLARTLWMKPFYPGPNRPRCRSINGTGMALDALYNQLEQFLLETRLVGLFRPWITAVVSYVSPT